MWCFLLGGCAGMGLTAHEVSGLRVKLVQWFFFMHPWVLQIPHMPLLIDCSCSLHDWSKASDPIQCFSYIDQGVAQRHRNNPERNKLIKCIFFLYTILKHKYRSVHSSPHSTLSSGHYRSHTHTETSVHTCQWCAGIHYHLLEQPA